MTLTQEQKKELVKTYGKDDKDSGSPEVQISLLTTRIRGLTEHSKRHPKDRHSRHGLIKLVSKRRKMLKHLKRRDLERYQKVVNDLGIRH
ncbi:MAG: 30S ribosomal protein S15 [Fidelibacterota bacterium]